MNWLHKLGLTNRLREQTATTTDAAGESSDLERDQSDQLQQATTHVPVTAAKLLEGKELPGQWRVIKRLAREDKGSTGGHFSESYIVEGHDGKRAFLKAVDFSKALGSDDPAKMLEEVVTAFNFERQLLDICVEHRMSKVATPISHGTVQVPEADGPNVTQYLIFELADGNLRQQTRNLDDLEISWKLATLHHVAIGLTQLHRQRIAHQDLKPSNVLIYEDDGSEVCDLGRALCERILAPHEENIIVGDRGYAPPEQLYRFVHEDRRVRRYAADAYLMGSMICFIFLGVPFTPLLISYLREEHRPKNWSGSFEAVLPYLRDAAGFAYDRFAKSAPEVCAAELTSALKQLCDVDPTLRGHPRTRASQENSYSLERYISLFNRLSHLSRVGRNQRS